MDLELKGKVALVFGAGGGLGGAISHVLAAEGATVLAADINSEAATSTADAIVAAGSKAMAISWDISDLAIIVDRLASIKSQAGDIDILVNNTGGPLPTPASGQPPELWRKHFDSMVMSVIAITDHVLPAMCKRKWGRVITSTSSGVVAPIPNLGISNAMRLALVGWSKTLAAEVGRDGITSNIILPGRIATQRIQFLDAQKAQRENRSVEDVTTASVASIPLGRYGSPQEYGDVVTFLASERASYITGSIIRVDGGLIPSV